MNGCQTCGGYGMHHDPVAHDNPYVGSKDFVDIECNGMCVMGNEVMPGGAFYDVAAHPHPDCPRHGD